MSGIVVISVSSGEYSCKSCLKEAIGELNLKNISIQQKETAFSIVKTQKVQDYQKKHFQQEMQSELTQVNNQILPVYTLKHAIHTLEEQGFSFNTQRIIQNGKRLIFNKYTGSGSKMMILTYNIDVYPAENRIVIDGGNMPNLECRKYSSKFEKSMGIVKSFTPHIQNQSTVKTHQHQRIQMGK